MGAIPLREFLGRIMHTRRASNWRRDRLNKSKVGGLAMSKVRVSRVLVQVLSLVWLATLTPLAAQAQANNKAVDEMLTQAQAALSKGRPEEAVSILRKAIDLDPNRADLYLLRSRARDSSGKFEAALDDASKFIELEPNETVGYLNRARIYLSLDKKAQALEDANKAITMAPEEPDGYYRRADIYNEMGKEAEAKADEDKADELDKKAR